MNILLTSWFSTYFKWTLVMTYMDKNPLWCSSNVIKLSFICHSDEGRISC
jgi:hypothetical protein